MRKGMKIGFSMILCIMLFCVIIPTSVSAGSATIKISYDGDWSGSLGGDTSKSVDGSGTETHSATGSVIVAVIQKDDDSSNRLKVEIIVNGNVVASETTTASYGVVSVSHSFLEDDFEEAEEEAEEEADSFCTACTILSIIGVIIAIVGVVLYKKRKSKKEKKSQQ